MKTSKFFQQETLTILARGFGYLRPYWKVSVAIYAAMAAINAINIAMPILIQWIIDRGIYENDTQILNFSILGLLGLAILKAVIVYFQGGWTEVVSQKVAYDLRNAIQRKLNALSFSFHDRMESGQILSRAIQDVDRIRFLTGRAVLRIVESAVLMVGTVIALIAMSPTLGLIVLLALPILVYQAYFFGQRYRPLSIKIQNQVGVLTSRIEQNLRGIQVVKGFAQEDAEIARFMTENASWFDLSARSARLQALSMPMLQLIANWLTVFILWYAGVMITQDQLTLGALVAFTTYLGQLLRPVRAIGRVLPALAIASSAGERVFEILDAESDIQDDPDAITPPEVKGHIRFEGVSFGYEGRKDVLKDISFEAQPGEVIALLGATGSGKSTIINLVARFYDPVKGSVTLDGRDLRKIKLHALRDQIGIVLQDTRLFAATIRENIALGDPDADEARVIAAAKDAQAHDFIMEIPKGYDTVIGERGVTLSGGQKQRIAIARALLTDPKILILDDATSSVDTETEHLIQLALDRLMQGRTSFVIAHRLSTVRRADNILVLENGRIAAHGTHDSLLQNSAQYAEIYRLQLRPQEIALLGIGGQR